MCGIAGMIDWRAATPADALRSIGEAMIETVRHRGPDAGDVWVEAEGGVALGQRRLAIIDLERQVLHCGRPVGEDLLDVREADVCHVYPLVRDAASPEVM